MILKKSDIKKLYEAGVAYYKAPSSNDCDEHRAYADVSYCIADSVDRYYGEIYRDLAHAVYDGEFENPVDKLCEVLGVLGIEVDYDN
jgi:hypothetical protein